MNCPLCNRRVYSNSAADELKPLWRAEHAWAHVATLQLVGLKRREAQDLEDRITALRTWVGEVKLGEWAD